MSMLVAPGRFASSGISARYWRIYITANQTANTDGYTSIQEIELRGTVGGADLTTTSTPTNQSDYYTFNGNSAAKTVDNDFSDYTSGCWVSDGSSPPHWLTYDLGSAKTVRQLAMWSQVLFPDRGPKDFKLQYASSLAGPWTDALNLTGVSGWVDTVVKTFNL